MCWSDSYSASAKETEPVSSPSSIQNILPAPTTDRVSSFKDSPTKQVAYLANPPITIASGCLLWKFCTVPAHATHINSLLCHPPQWVVNWPIIQSFLLDWLCANPPMWIDEDNICHRACLQASSEWFVLPISQGLRSAAARTSCTTKTCFRRTVLGVHAYTVARYCSLWWTKFLRCKRTYGEQFIKQLHLSILGAPAYVHFLNCCPLAA